MEARADVIVPVSPREAFEAAVDLDEAPWLPSVRRIRHTGGPRTGAGARYEVEVGAIGRHLQGTLVCREATAPSRAVFELEDGMPLIVTLTTAPVAGGCRLELAASYRVGAGAWGLALERASGVAARRELARAVEQFAAQFGRKAAPARTRRREGREATSGGRRRG